MDLVEITKAQISVPIIMHWKGNAEIILKTVLVLYETPFPQCR